MDSSTHENLRGPAPKAIIFYDGACGVCQHSVRWILQHDHKGQFSFAPLQGETAGRLLPASFVKDLDSLVVRMEGCNYQKSAALWCIIRGLGGRWLVVLPFFWLPAALLNSLYDFVVRRRQALSGRLKECPLPTEKHRKRFLP